MYDSLCRRDGSQSTLFLARNLVRKKQTTVCLINSHFQHTATDCLEYLEFPYHKPETSGKNSLFLRVVIAVLLFVNKLGQDLLIRQFIFFFSFGHVNAI